MRYLIVARHGEYNRPYQDPDHARICARGQYSTEILAQALARFLAGHTPHIYSSPCTYAHDSALVISREFETEPVIEPSLRVDVDYWLDEIGRAISFIERCRDEGVEIAIIVTHYEYAVHLIPHLKKKWLGSEMEPLEVGYSGCTVLECPTGTVFALP